MSTTDAAYTQNNYAGTPYGLLARFDDFCLRYDISYFAVGDTLVGAVCYGDFIPDDFVPDRAGDAGSAEGAKVVRLGMLRAEFRKLEQALGAAGDARESCGFSLGELLDEDGCFTLSAASEGRGPQGVGGAVRIAVYDGVTDDYDLTRFQLFRIKKLRAFALKQGGSARKVAEGRAQAVAGMYSGKACSQVANLLGGDDHMVDYDAVAHTLRVPFGPVSISVPLDTGAWIETDREAEASRVHAVQQVSLDLAREVDRICRANGIGYFICAGTLLGAVRYGGFIPWDDDMDIGMLRDDYDRFLECAKDQLGERFFLQTRDTDPAVPYLYAKVRMNGTEYVTAYTESRGMHKGVSLDIFPFDYAPVGKPGFDEHLAQANKLIKAHKSRAARQVPDGMPRRRAKNPVEAVGHAVMTARHRRYNALSTAETYDAYVAHVSKFARGECSHAASYVAYFTCIPLDDLLPYEEVDFEGLKMFAPRNPDPLLRMQFGDYLKEPAPHLRHAHRVLSWKA